MLQKSNTDIVASLFYQNPSKEYYLMEVSRKIKLAHTSTKRELDALIQKEIILVKTTKKGSRRFPIYIANISNLNYKKNKRLYNIENIINSGLIEYIKDNYMPKCIILFGSYLYGEDTKESDIDIFVEAKIEKITLEKFERKLGHTIQVHHNENFSGYPKELKNNIINGFILDGYLEAIYDNTNAR